MIRSDGQKRLKAKQRAYVGVQGYGRMRAAQEDEIRSDPFSQLETPCEIGHTSEDG